MNKLTPMVVLGLVSSQAFAVSVDQYLNEVKEKNFTYQSSAEKFEGAQLQKREADLFFKPQFFFNFQKGYDSKLFNPPFLVYDEVRSQSFMAGISQEFSFGVETKLSYSLTKTEYKGISFAEGIANPYWDAAPVLEVNIPLWGNAFGRTSKARKELALQQRIAEQYSASAQGQQTVIDAEIAYWKLAAAQESVAIQKKALESAKNIHDYVSNKFSKSLGDKADVLQAEALNEAYRLQLEQAQIEERAARRKYNFYLNRDADEVVPALDKLDYKGLASERVPTVRPGDRPDVRASQAQVALARAQSQLAVEQNKPTLNLFGGYSLFGRDGQQSRAISQAGYDYRDSAYFGVKFNMPLNVSAQTDAREGASKSLLAAEISNRQVAYAQEQNWVDLVYYLKDAQTSLKLAQAMEKAQKSKLENERVRLRQGRTTTYQVLLFEQDFLSSEVQRIRAATQIINLKSQIKLYNQSSEG